MKIGITFATLLSSGKIPVLNDKLAISRMHVERKTLHILKICTGELLGPNDLLILRDCIISATSRYVAGFR